MNVKLGQKKKFQRTHYAKDSQKSRSNITRRRTLGGMRSRSKLSGAVDFSPLKDYGTTLVSRNLKPGRKASSI